MSSVARHPRLDILKRGFLTAFEMTFSFGAYFLKSFPRFRCVEEM